MSQWLGGEGGLRIFIPPHIKLLMENFRCNHPNIPPPFPIPKIETSHREFRKKFLTSDLISVNPLPNLGFFMENFDITEILLRSGRLQSP